MEKKHAHNPDWNEKRYTNCTYERTYFQNNFIIKNIISPQLISPDMKFVSIWYRFQIKTLHFSKQKPLRNHWTSEKKIIEFSHQINWFFEFAWKLASEFIVQPQMSSKTQFSLDYQYLCYIRSLFARQNDLHHESIPSKWKSVLEFEICFQTQTLEIAFIQIIYRNFKELSENLFDRMENVANNSHCLQLKIRNERWFAWSQRRLLFYLSIKHLPRSTLIEVLSYKIN